jgi:hypothetical protein
MKNFLWLFYLLPLLIVLRRIGQDFRVVGKELMIFDLLPIEAPPLAFLQHSVDKISKDDIHGAGKPDSLMQYLRFELVYAIGIEGLTSCGQFIQNDPERPNINLVVVFSS